MKGIKITCFSLLMFACFSVFAQPQIIGPQCVLPGISYQYTVMANWAPNEAVKVCITGGKLSGDSVCTPDGKIPFMIFVTWNENDTLKRIELTSNAGNVHFKVKSTTALAPGMVDNADKFQEYSTDTTSYLFRCKEASGGHCSPNYVYQWQLSDNGVQWKNIDAANSKDLKFTGRIKETTFFRRVTTETNSSTIGYSDQGILSVKFN